MTADQLTRLASILAGQARANDALLSVLIATHPDPDMLHRLWQQLKPDRIDEEHELMFAAHGPYLQAFLQRLAAVTGEIDAAAGRTD